jgi:hypothetical protein
MNNKCYNYNKLFNEISKSTKDKSLELSLYEKRIATVVFLNWLPPINFDPKLIIEDLQYLMLDTNLYKSVRLGAILNTIEKGVNGFYVHETVIKILKKDPRISQF